MDYIRESIDSDRIKWKNVLSDIENAVDENQISIQNVSSSSDIKNQLRAKRELVFNMIFQLLLRHKFEKEFFRGVRVPIISSDSLLNNGLRKIQIYAATRISNDAEIIKISFGEEDKEIPNYFEDDFGSSPNVSEFIYDPKTVNDSITIKVSSINLLNNETTISELKYKTLK